MELRWGNCGCWMWWKLRVKWVEEDGADRSAADRLRGVTAKWVQFKLQPSPSTWSAAQQQHRRKPSFHPFIWSVMETGRLMGTVPGCQLDWIISQPTFNWETRCKVDRDPIQILMVPSAHSHYVTQSTSLIQLRKSQGHVSARTRHHFPHSAGKVE